MPEFLLKSCQDAGAVVFWASQGGTAETMASRYASELSATFSTVFITAEMADYDAKHLSKIPQHKLAVFLVSTFGEGSPPDNGAEFLNALRELHQQGHKMSNLRYVMFGLGNSNYTHFNKYALDVDIALQDMGATRLGELGLGDDRKGGTEEDFLAWKTDVEPELSKALDIKPMKRAYAPQIRISLRDDGIDDTTGLAVYRGEPLSAVATNTSGSYALPILQAKSLASSETRHCIHLDFSLENFPAASYQTGDYLRIWPVNPDHEVEALLRVLNVWDKRKTVINISPIDSTSRSRVRLPTSTTAESFFRYCLDICGPVSREMIGDIAEFTEDTKTKQKLQALTSEKQAFAQQVTANKLTLAAVLQAIMTSESRVNIPLSFVLERLKKLQPRSYSISSSAIVEPRVISITALAECDPPADSPSSYRFRGLASNYLLQLQQECNGAQSSSVLYSTAGPGNLLQGGKVFAQVRRSNFKLPQNPATPIIMIGSGTGIAPFRAFVQERMKLKEQGAVVGRTILFVGHRSPDEDYYYSDLWQEARSVIGDAFEVYTAFSRAKGQDQQYVQEVLASKADVVLGTLAAGQDGVLYICGSSLMARGVRKCLEDIWLSQISQDSGVLSGATADEWLMKLGQERSLQEDSWG